jgi:hypothetical protein
MTEFKFDSADSQPSGIVTGPDKALWFTELNVMKIGRWGL